MCSSGIKLDLIAGHGQVGDTSGALHQTGMPSSSGMQAGEQHDHFICLQNVDAETAFVLKLA